MTTPRFGKKPLILPAIDLRGGRVVRLVRGAGDAQIDYSDKPREAAGRWLDAGASCLHIIDLGAALGEADSLTAVEEIIGSFRIPVQVGGGIRDRDRVERLLGGGVSRVILGTQAFKDAVFLQDIIGTYGQDRVVLAMDSADGRVKVSGWTEDSSLDVGEGLEFAADHGVGSVLVTAIDRDGTLSGPHLPLVRKALDLAQTHGLEVIVAGGIGKLEDVRSVLELGSPKLAGIVLGRALYDGTVDLTEALKVAAEFEREGA